MKRHAFFKGCLRVLFFFFFSFSPLSSSCECADFPEPGFRWKLAFQVQPSACSRVVDLENEHRQLFEKTSKVKALLDQVLNDESIHHSFLFHFITLLCESEDSYLRFSPYFWNLNDGKQTIRDIIRDTNFSPPDLRVIDDPHKELDTDDFDDLVEVLRIMQGYLRDRGDVDGWFNAMTCDRPQLGDSVLSPRDFLNTMLQVRGVQRIIRENIKRVLDGRNFCMASFSCLYDDHIQNMSLTHQMARDAVFVSGTGNEILRVLETFGDFRNYMFVIFTRGPQRDTEIALSFLRRNLKNLFQYDVDSLPENIKKKRQDFLMEVEEYEVKLKDFDSLYEKEAKRKVQLEAKLKTLDTASRSTVFELEDAVDRYKKALRSYEEELLEAIRRNHGLLDVLERTDGHVRNPELYRYFCHSEQVMLLFFYNQLTREYIEGLNLQDGLRGIVFNVYSTNDTCERCTFTFFYELLQAHVNSKIRHQDQDASMGKKSISVFEKFNNILYGIKGWTRGDDPVLEQAIPFGIFISSTNLESDGASARRAFMAHDGYEADPVLVDHFSPLVAFCVYPRLPEHQHYQVTPLTPFLRPQYERALRRDISYGNNEGVQKLLRAPMNPWVTDHHQWTSLHVLAQRHERDLQIMVMQHLKRQYRNPRWHEAFLIRNKDGDTSLHVAVNHDNTTFLNTVLAEGFPWWIFSYVRGAHGNTLMHTAAAKGSQVMVQFLRDLYPRYQGESFDMSVRTDENLTVLDVAERNGHLDEIRKLLS